VDAFAQLCHVQTQQTKLEIVADNAADRRLLGGAEGAFDPDGVHRPVELMPQ
jgi:hypothetical protein